jgi:hypothetical protein
VYQDSTTGEMNISLNEIGRRYSFKQTVSFASSFYEFTFIKLFPMRALLIPIIIIIIISDRFAQRFHARYLTQAYRRACFVLIFHESYFILGINTGIGRDLDI